MEELERVCVVLVRARNPANIGAVARAMHDFGFRHLRVVNDFAAPFEAARSAVDASAVIAAAVRYDTLAEAVGDCTLVVGTTAVGERDLEHELVTLAEARPRLRAELRREADEDANCPRIAIVFGSEKTGLSNQELSHCNWLMTIPMQEYAGMRHPSMNLGQAVAVCLYELVREAVVDQAVLDGRAGDDDAAVDAAADAATDAAVNAATLERLTRLVLEVMEKTGYTRRHAPGSSPEQVRRLVRRMGANAGDAPVWLGFLRQVLWKLGS